jgi:hypothetical protein
LPLLPSPEELRIRGSWTVVAAARKDDVGWVGRGVRDAVPPFLA